MCCSREVCVADKGLPENHLACCRSLVHTMSLCLWSFHYCHRQRRSIYSTMFSPHSTSSFRFSFIHVCFVASRPTFIRTLDRPQRYIVVCINQINRDVRLCVAFNQCEAYQARKLSSFTLTFERHAMHAKRTKRTATKKKVEKNDRRRHNKSPNEQKK